MSRQLLIYVHSDCLGDAMFKLPAIADLRRLFPGFHIIWLAGRDRSMYCGALGPLVRDYLDEIHDCAGIGASWRELLGPAPMPGRHFDIVIDTQTSVRPTLCLRRVRHDLFVSPAANYMFSGRRPAKGKKKIVSVQRQLLDLFSLASGMQAAPVYAIDCPGEFRGAADRLLRPGLRYCGIAPGAGAQYKCWPLSKYISLARKLEKLGLVPVFLLGPDELSWRETLSSELPGAIFPEQDAVAMGLPGGPLLTLALAGKLAVAVANDSGAGHILAAARCSLVSLFGPTNPDRFAEAAENRVILRAQEWGGPDLNNIDVDRVFLAVTGLLERGPAPSG